MKCKMRTFPLVLILALGILVSCQSTGEKDKPSPDNEKKTEKKDEKKSTKKPSSPDGLGSDNNGDPFALGGGTDDKNWLHSLDKGKAQAASTKKPLLVKISAPG